MAKLKKKIKTQNAILGTLATVHINKLFLDPNNYRFIDNNGYMPVPSNKITNKDIQSRTLSFLTGKRRDSIQDLVDSFKRSGLLPVDMIQVEMINKNAYRVIEGNRRVAALKSLFDDFKKKLDLGKFKPDVFKAVPVVVYEKGEEINHQIIMGLKHINGNKTWPPLNQAQLLKDLQTNGLSEDEISARLTIGRAKFRKSLRALSLIDEYKKSDYGDQFITEMYAIFEEAVNKPDIRDWLEWDDTLLKPINEKNQVRFFSWISNEEEETTNEDDETDVRHLNKIITKSTEIRELATFISDPKALVAMEAARSISQGYLLSDRVGKDKFLNSLNIIEDQIDIANKFSGYSSSDGNDKLRLLLNKLKGLAITKGMIDVLSKSDIERRVSVQFKNKQFKGIQIKTYRKLNNFNIEGFNRINIFGGNNNSGKSSLLESIYMLTKQNDIFAILELYKKRGKFTANLPSKWIFQQLKEKISIQGIFDDKDTSFEMFAEEEFDNSLDKSLYIGTIQINSEFSDSHSESQFRLYSNKDGQPTFKSLNVVCNSIYSTPYLLFDKSELLRLHEKSIESKLWGKIVEFIVKNIDTKVISIDLVTDDDMHRFYVNCKDLADPLDLTSFGDGMQRILFIAMQFALCTNGVILLDELENAIHYSLLVEFSRLIEQLSEQFNVQVFITSHSKECIEAFVKNGNKEDSITFFNLSYDDATGKIKCTNAVRSELEILIDNSNADLREK